MTKKLGMTAKDNHCTYQTIRRCPTRCWCPRWSASWASRPRSFPRAVAFQWWVSAEICGKKIGWMVYEFNDSLVGGEWNMTGLFSHILGMIIPIDVHIFQRGSNHQPVPAEIWIFLGFSLALRMIWWEGQEKTPILLSSLSNYEQKRWLRYQISTHSKMKHDFDGRFRYSSWYTANCLQLVPILGKCALAINIQWEKLKN